MEVRFNKKAAKKKIAGIMVLRFKKSKLKLVGIISLFLFSILLISLAVGTLYSPTDERSISTGQNADWYYIKFQRPGVMDYIGVNKNSRGDIGFTHEGNYIGKIIPIVAGKISGDWYLCPVRNADVIDRVDMTDNSLSFGAHGNFTCYRYSDNNPVTAEITINDISLVASENGNLADTKLTLNATVTSHTLDDTGAGYFFYPDDSSKFGFVNINGTLYDLAGVEGSVPVDKAVQFFDQNQNSITRTWNWNDMPEGTDYLAEIRTIFGSKGLLYGSYGYGASQNIYVDPIFSADYSPSPSQWLLTGDVDSDADSEFVSIVDITTNMSDNSSATMHITNEEQTLIWFNDSFGKRKEINITNVGTTNLSSFPAFINVAFDSDMQEDFDDLRFINGSCDSPGGNLLNHEIENYTSSEAHVWVRVPTLSTGVTSICMYYNSSTLDNGENIVAVWDDDFLAVHHLDGNDLLEVLDSTQYENNMTFVENTPGYGSTGIVGNAIDFEASSSERIAMSDSPSLNAIGNTLTMSAWIQPNFDETGATGTIMDKRGAGGGGDGGYRLIFITAADDFRFIFDDGVGTAILDTVGISFTAGDWHHIVATYNSTIMAIYWDGELLETGTETEDVFPNDLDLTLGGNAEGGAYWDGAIDDARISNVSRSSDWINQSYQIVQNQGTIVIFGDEQIDSEASAITAKFNQTDTDSYEYWLRVNKRTAGDHTISIFAYDDEDNISSQNTTASLPGVGWFNINVSSLMDYMTNTVGLNYSSFRFWTNSSASFSEVMLRKEVNDTQPPSIINCMINNTDLQEGEKVRLNCTITDNVEISSVNGSVSGTRYDFSQEDGMWYLDWTCDTNGEFNWHQVHAFDLVGQENLTTVNLNWSCKILTITQDALYPMNFTGAVNAFNSTYLRDIEYANLTITLNLNEGNISHLYLNFTADGPNSCALGNKQSDVCYNYTSMTNKWIQFINGSETATFKDEGSEGDSIVMTTSGNATHTTISYLIDEHYNPNVFKWYDAGFNFSDVKFQNGTDERIFSGQPIRVEVNTSKIPVSADEYKIDFRVIPVNLTIPLEDMSPLDIYACNENYTGGDYTASENCSFISQRNPLVFQDDGTKVRSITTKELTEDIGQIKYLFIDSSILESEGYYALKTYKSTTANWTTHWEFSDDGGDTWNNSQDGYETELNVNWFYDGGMQPTIFRYLAWVNSTEGPDKILEGNITWNIIVPGLPPIVTVNLPETGASIELPFNVTWTARDPNNDILNITLRLFNTDGSLNYTIIENITNTGFFLWQNETDEGTYDLNIEACEVNTSFNNCRNHSHQITVIVDSCTPPDQPNNWTINLTHLCNITNYANLNLTPGGINFVDEGDLTFIFVNLTVGFFERLANDGGTSGDIWLYNGSYTLQVQ